MSKTITVTLTFNQDDLLDQLREAGSMFDLELKQDLDTESFVKEFKEDLTNFIEEGLNQDLYQDYFNWKDEEEDEDEFTVM